MAPKDHDVMMGLDRLNALFNWWGVSNGQGNGAMEAQFKRFQSFTAELQRSWGEAYNSQVQGLLAANERLARSLQELARCRDPQEVLAAESTILATLMEGAQAQAQNWVELTQKLQQSYVAMAREATENLAKTTKR